MEDVYWADKLVDNNETTELSFQCFVIDAQVYQLSVILNLAK